jgi:hypothetical protein
MQMKAQEPAEGILKRNDFGDCKWYQVVCGCGQEYHDHNFEVEASETGVDVNIGITVKTNYWGEIVEKHYDIEDPYMQEVDWFWKDLVNGIWNRLKVTWEVWTTGAVTCQTTITMSEQQALNYAETLKSAVEDVKHFKDERKWKQDLQNRIAKKLAEESDCV